MRLNRTVSDGSGISSQQVTLTMGGLMAGLSLVYSRKKLQRRKLTSLQALAFGHLLCARLDGLTIAKFGQDRAPASHSVMQVAARVPTMNDTYGQSGLGLSEHTDPLSSLASRFQAKTRLLGSTLYQLTWKESATPSGRSVPTLQASVHRIGVNDCTSWPTTTVNDSKGSGYSYANGDHTRPVLKLPGAVLLASWPTCTKHDAKGSGPSQFNRHSLMLPEAVQLAAWGTPTANEPGGTAAAVDRKIAARLAGSTLGCSVTSLSHQVQLVDIGQTLNGSDVPMEKPGRLNPAHSLWLMGIPNVWLSCAPLVTPSSSHTRKHS